jgi:hypothetical protein
VYLEQLFRETLNSDRLLAPGLAPFPQPELRCVLEVAGLPHRWMSGSMGWSR